ncbi:TetR/AcrR family transcriptional regulator [Streptomyces sp. NRRL B-24484]|uniref:TetR/AcrR family transcriptional regulator n=1 Tax=Streptomyces sp. NRRL B-24484 TaxID=1463833 RepID=UPI0005BE871D|nr:TetR/AcrR family transcriptional regulator [Streptomyces sp. NRRL B-24484]
MHTEPTVSACGADEDGPAAELCAPRRGRPRSEAAEQAIFAAVEDLMESGKSLSELSVERIAAAAGVGKATIYRRWPNKEALLVEVVARLESPLPEPSGGTVREELVRMVDYMRKRGLAKRSRWMLKSALSQMNAWPELREAYQEQVVKPRRELARAIVRRGVDEGVLRSDIDVELVCEIIIGPILLRSVLWDEAPLDDPDLAEQMVDAVLNGVGAQPSGGRSR